MPSGERPAAVGRTPEPYTVLISEFARGQCAMCIVNWRQWRFTLSIYATVRHNMRRDGRCGREADNTPRARPRTAAHTSHPFTRAPFLVHREVTVSTPSSSSAESSGRRYVAAALLGD
eukprot:338643-Prymnesium_polylepis.1